MSDISDKILDRYPTFFKPYSPLWPEQGGWIKGASQNVKDEKQKSTCTLGVYLLRTVYESYA